MVAVCTLGCTRKKSELHSWQELFNLDGDYSLYFNYELQGGETSCEALPRLAEYAAETGKRYTVDTWMWSTAGGFNWRAKPKFDQDQARLSSIVTARSMCIEYAMQTDASHLLFIDADIIPPRGIIPKLLEVNHPSVAGLVHGRGIHSSSRYVFGEKRAYKHECGAYVIEAEHANIGFTMLSKQLFNEIRFRYGVSKYPDGRGTYMISDDPAYHLDAFIKFGHWMLIRTDVVGKHIGDLKPGDTAQY